MNSKLLDNFKYPNIYVFGVSKVGEAEKNIWIMTDNFSNLIKL